MLVKFAALEALVDLFIQGVPKRGKSVINNQIFSGFSIRLREEQVLTL